MGGASWSGRAFSSVAATCDGGSCARRCASFGYGGAASLRGAGRKTASFPPSADSTGPADATIASEAPCRRELSAPSRCVPRLSRSTAGSSSSATSDLATRRAAAEGSPRPRSSSASNASTWCERREGAEPSIGEPCRGRCRGGLGGSGSAGEVVCGDWSPDWSAGEATSDDRCPAAAAPRPCIGGPGVPPPVPAAAAAAAAGQSRGPIGCAE